MRSRPRRSGFTGLLRLRGFGVLGVSGFRGLEEKRFTSGKEVHSGLGFGVNKCCLRLEVYLGLNGFACFEVTLRTNPETPISLN